MELRDIMTADPVVCPSTCSITEAAAVMRDENIGDVLVEDDQGRPCGIVTDRDLVIRGVAGDGDVSSLTLGDVCDKTLHSVQVDANVDDVIALMQDKALRRVPVMQDGQVVGIVSLGDLATRLDADSTLGTISSAAPDR